MNDDPLGEIPPAHATESEEEDESPPIEKHAPEEQDEESMEGSDPTEPEDVELLFFLRDEVRNAQAQSSAQELAETLHEGGISTLQELQELFDLEVGKECGVRPGVAKAIVNAINARSGITETRAERSPVPSTMTQVDASTGQAAVDKKVMRIEDKSFSIRTSEKLRVEPGSAEPSHPNRAAWG